MNVLHIIDSLGRGGAETLLISTVQELKRKHPSVNQTLVTLYDQGELKENVKGLVNYCSLNLKRSNILLSIFKLNKIIKDNNIEVVHSHLLHATFLARLALPRKVGLVSTYHSVFYEPSMVTYARKELIIDRFTYRSKYFSIFVSEAVRQNISTAVGIAENFKVLLNFASEKFTPAYVYNPEKSLRIIMVGNLHEIKNHEIAIKGLADFKHLPISIDIYGDGHLRTYLNNIIVESQVKVSLKGKVAITSDILKSYDLFLMSSHHEGMPISLLEAMQTGVPSLLNDISMLKETAEDAALYYNYNDLDALKEKLKYILNNKNILETVSKNALKRSSFFSASIYIIQLVNIYDSVKSISK